MEERKKHIKTIWNQFECACQKEELWFSVSETFLPCWALGQDRVDIEVFRRDQVNEQRRGAMNSLSAQHHLYKKNNSGPTRIKTPFSFWYKIMICCFFGKNATKYFEIYISVAKKDEKTLTFLRFGILRCRRTTKNDEHTQWQWMIKRVNLRTLQNSVETNLNGLVYQLLWFSRLNLYYK